IRESSGTVICGLRLVRGMTYLDDIAFAAETGPLRILRLCCRVPFDAFLRFNKDDGWAIASHIALSVLMAMFPFLILVTALAGFIGSRGLANEVAQLIVAAWPPEVSAPIAAQIQNVLTTARGDVLTLGAVFALYFSSTGVES